MKVTTNATNNTEVNPIDIVGITGVDDPTNPYQPGDPIGWVESIAAESWNPIKCIIERVNSLPYACDFTELPSPPANQCWHKFDLTTRTWVPLSSEQDLPLALFGADIESARALDGRASDPYKPFLLSLLGGNYQDTELSWYTWAADLGSELPDLVPFPDNRIIVNHNLCGYDRRYFSCEYAQVGPSNNIYLDTMALGTLMNGIVSKQTLTYKSYKKQEASGAGVPLWFTKATTGGLAEMVKFYTGKEMNKTVRSYFEKMSHRDLARAMKDSGNIEITPTTVYQYGYADVQRTCDLFRIQFAKAQNYIPSTVSWLGGVILGNQRIFLDGDEGLEKFLLKTEQEYDEKLRGISARMMAVATVLLEKYNEHETVASWRASNEQLAKLSAQEKQLKRHKKELAEAISEGEASLNKFKPEECKCGEFAVARDQYAAEIKEMPGRTFVNESERDERLKELKALKTKAQNGWRGARDRWLKSNPDSVLATLMTGYMTSKSALARELKEVRDQIKKVKYDLAQITPQLKSVGDSLNPYLNWSVLSAGPDKGKVAWYRDFAAAESKLGSMDAVHLLEFHWQGQPIWYRKNEEEDPGYSPTGTTGTWVTGTPENHERLPKIDQGDNLGSPICTDYWRFVVSAELTTPHFSQEQLKSLFRDHMDCTQWVMYRKRYAEIYRQQTPWGNLSTTDTNPWGTVSARTKGWAVVLPHKSSKVGSSIRKVLSAGKGRVLVKRDCAAQESKYLAMLVDAQAGRNYSTPWSEAVLKGEKSKKTDIHNLVSQFCTNALDGFKSSATPALLKLIGELQVTRQDGKTLNFTSAYGASVATLAMRLVQDSDYPYEVAEFVATVFIEYLKGAKGIAVEEFATLKLITKLNHYRTPALGRKISDALDHAYCQDFQTSRGNWTIQSGCADMLSIISVVVNHLCDLHGIDAFLLVTEHDALAYSVIDDPQHLASFDAVFNFSHAIAKECIYQGTCKWARELRGDRNIQRITCPPTDIFFEEMIEEDGIPTRRVTAHGPVDERYSFAGPGGLNAGLGEVMGEVPDLDAILDAVG